MKARGISNPTGTACHLSSALVVFCHCLHPLRRAVVQTASSSSSSSDNTLSFCSSLGAFCRSYCTDQSSKPLDPIEIYDAIKRYIGINFYQLGDAVTALVKILQQLRLESVFQELFDITVDGGKVHICIKGHNVNGELKFCKETKSRPMSCPLSLSREYDSIQASFDARWDPVQVEGYQWQRSFSNKDTIPIESDNQQQEELINTTKTLAIDRLPTIWLIYLDPPALNKSEEMQISSTMSVHHDNSDSSYELVGGILHVTYLNREADEEAGDHNVALIREDDQQWALVDDEKVTAVVEDDAMKFFSGSEASYIEEGAYMRGMLLVYQRKSMCHDAIDVILSKVSHDNTDHRIDWSFPNSLVGRRLSIAWSKGEKYSGHVASYDESSGKHTVLYDDGDVRQYKLQKKTIEWL